MGSSIRELEVVVLSRDIPEHHLRAGDLGTVVFVHDGGYEVEFIAPSGMTIAVETLNASDVRRANDTELHAGRPH